MWARIWGHNTTAIPHSHSRTFLKTINFAVFEDFTAALKIISSKSYCSIQLAVTVYQILEIYFAKSIMKTYNLENSLLRYYYPLYGILIYCIPIVSEIKWSWVYSGYQTSSTKSRISNNYRYVCVSVCVCVCACVCVCLCIYICLCLCVCMFVMY